MSITSVDILDDWRDARWRGASSLACEPAYVPRLVTRRRNRHECRLASRTACPTSAAVRYDLDMLSWFASLLALGALAPDFTLRDDSGNPVHLADFRGRPIVLVFYPMDETPVCRKQLCEFRDHWQEFQQRGVVVLGVNPGSASSHTKFRKNQGFPFPLLVDDGKKVAELYNASGLVIRRTVYGIGKDGRVVFAERGKPDPSRVLAALTVQ